MTTRTGSRVSSILGRLADLPSLPAVVDKLLRMSEMEASFKDFARIIATDQGLTAKVLRLVNSAFYSLRSPISDLPHACSMIGMRTLKSMVLSVSVMQLFKRRCRGFDVTSFWRHSLATALAGRRLGGALGLEPSVVERAYLAGLLHACGVPLFAQSHPRDYEKLLAQADGSEDALLDLEAEFFGVSHDEIGAEIAAHWRLPDPIADAIRYQARDPSGYPEDLPLEVAQLTSVVRVADLFVRAHGLDFMGADRAGAGLAVEVPSWMGLDRDGLATAIGDLNATLVEIEDLFQV